jgi:ring-1,2-phenylacetyl-CoA epoxidase subunit PaaC
MLELPRGDFGFTIMRQFLFSAFAQLHLEGVAAGTDADLAAIAAKAYKETRYHLRHSAEWVVRLGDGTGESHGRMQAALDELWPWTAEFFHADAADSAMAAAGAGPALEALRAPWESLTRDVLTRATLTVPDTPMRMAGGRAGRHTEHLGHLLAEMQIVARSHPGASW